MREDTGPRCLTGVCGVQLFQQVRGSEDLSLFEVGGRRTPLKQEVHSLEAVKLLELDLKRTLNHLVTHLFGPGERSSTQEVMSEGSCDVRGGRVTSEGVM